MNLRMGITVKRDNGMIRHPKFPFLLAHVDGLIEHNNKKGIFEAKTAGMQAVLSRTWAPEREELKARPDDIPVQYYYQIQWYLMILNREFAYLAVLLGGNEDFRVYYFERDYELGIVMRKNLKNFWLNNVLKKIPPTPSCVRDSANIHQTQKSDFKTSTSSISKLIYKAKIIRSQLKALFAQKEALDCKITDFIGSSKGIKDNDGHTEATWKETKANKRLLRLY